MRAFTMNEGDEGGDPGPAESNRTNAGGGNRRVLAGSPAHAHDLDSVELCSVTEGMGGWVCVYCWTSSSLMGEPGRDELTTVEVGMRVFVVDGRTSVCSSSFSSPPSAFSRLVKLLAFVVTCENGTTAYSPSPSLSSSSLRTVVTLPKFRCDCRFEIAIS